MSGRIFSTVTAFLLKGIKLNQKKNNEQEGGWIGSFILD